MLHSVVQGHFLCDCCLLCIRTWDALYIACGLVKKWVLLRKLGSHRSRSKSQSFPDLCVPTKRDLRPGESAGYTLWICVPEQGPCPYSQSFSLLMGLVQISLCSEGYWQTAGVLCRLQELSRKASYPKPIGLRGPREVGGRSFRRMKPLVSC